MRSPSAVARKEEQGHLGRHKDGVANRQLRLTYCVFFLAPISWRLLPVRYSAYILYQISLFFSSNRPSGLKCAGICLRKNVAVAKERVGENSVILRGREGGEGVSGRECIQQLQQ